MTDLSGKYFGKYEVKSRLGRGGMGEVYRAFHPTLEREVAIKTIHTHLADDPKAVDRFRQEARVVAALRHPGIVQVHDFDVEGDAFYMVMEFVPGESLQQRLALLHDQGQRLPLDEALALFQSITQAVAYAHSQGVIHRDLKPANVLLTAGGQPVLADFGLSKIISGRQLTTPGDVLGTPHYM
ncbi:MAG TPA: serine/threonine-protein kinase, partial [Burkholderiaceae bacterium]|nr:serine/threonine-protein kinase [Burkholderiaceae bacterium]